ncbi:MAG: hypothetical protein KDA42_03395 [Planctomycetales bacterium]|nr:hypothetical protein [Planctomycetales bacterium]
MTSRLLFALSLACLAATQVEAETTFDDVPSPPSTFAPAFSHRTGPKVTYSSTVRRSTPPSRPVAQPVRHRREPVMEYGPYATIGKDSTSSRGCATCRSKTSRSRDAAACDATGACDETCATCDSAACDKSNCESCATCSTCSAGRRAQSGCRCAGKCQCHQHGGCHCQQAAGHEGPCTDVMCLGKGGQDLPCMTCAHCEQCQGARHPLHGTLFHSTCDMHQHLPYCSRPNSYYYFRPYQIEHVAIQQEFVRSYGGNPKHPYENSVFDRVYNGTESAEVVMPMIEGQLIPTPIEQDGN